MMHTYAMPGHCGELTKPKRWNNDANGPLWLYATNQGWNAVGGGGWRGGAGG